jgi:hypothetical protein
VREGVAEAISGTSERNLREMAKTTDLIRTFVEYKLGPVRPLMLFFWFIALKQANPFLAH